MGIVFISISLAKLNRRCLEIDENNVDGVRLQLGVAGLLGSFFLIVSVVGF